MSPLNDPLILSIFAYSVGSIPFSLIVTKLKGIDLRSIGSGNLGATNVFRALGFNYALLVFLLDMSKGFIPTMMALNTSEHPWFHIAIGTLSVLGHSFSPFVKFRGGKGAATGLGILLAISPNVFSIIFIIALIGIYITRYVAPVTIACSILTPILLATFSYPTPYILFTTGISIFIIWRHKSNIVRLIKGDENRV